MSQNQFYHLFQSHVFSIYMDVLAPHKGKRCDLFSVCRCFKLFVLYFIFSVKNGRVIHRICESSAILPSKGE